MLQFRKIPASSQQAEAEGGKPGLELAAVDAKHRDDVFNLHQKQLKPNIWYSANE
jgi:hypothetical protein